MYRVVFRAADWRLLEKHFQDGEDEERGAFLLTRSGVGTFSHRLLVREVIVPDHQDWETAESHRLRPSGQSLSAALGAAIDTGCGLSFIHTHPDPRHPPNLSPLDRSTSRDWRESLCGSTGQAFASLVWSPRGLAGEVFRDALDDGSPVSRFDITGDGAIRIQVADATRGLSEQDDRQARALGAIGAANLRELNIGVIGAGGTGSAVADSLARLGVARITIVDHDVLDQPSNLRRVVGSRRSDVAGKTPKVTIVERNVVEAGLDTEVAAIFAAVENPDAQRQLIDCDVLICTTDTQSSRAIANQLSFQFGIPLVDVGLRVGTTTQGGVTGMPVDVRVLMSDTGCLWCRRVLNSNRIREELLPESERASLAQEGYVTGIQGPQPSLAPLNSFASSTAVLTAIRLLYGDRAPAAGFLLDPWELYVQEMTSEVDPKCICHDWRFQGDSLGLPAV